MKNSLVVILFLNVFFVHAQNPNPDLFQTWYLSFVQSSDLGSPYEVSEIEPEITPTLTILENFEFYGVGACNTFSGVFDFLDSVTVQTIDYSYTNEVCNVQVHNFFESEFFSFMSGGGYYEITQVENGLVLSIMNPIFGQAIFKNFVLSANNFELTSIQIYPNPSSDRIFIKSNNSMIEKIEIYNAIGQLNKSVISDFNSLDISDLFEGVYSLKIYTENGVFSKKIIKN
jgi:hypothetical protein